MRKVFLFVLFFLLVIAPALPMVMESTDNYQSTTVPSDVPKELLDDVQAPDTIPEGDVELDMMFFTETASSENGLYYVCRRGTDAVAYFGASMVKYLSGGTVFTLEFPGSRSVVPRGERSTGSVTNYMYGNDPSKWKTGIQDYAALRYPEIYPGIDLVYKVQDGNLKYEFVVGPYSNPQVIKMEYSDADSIRIDMDGVTVSREGNQMADTKLKVYQQQQEKVPVGCKFHLENCETIIFILDVYNPALDLIIDPINLFYSTYIGGSSTEYGRSIAVEDGSIYITGETGSADFPMKNAYNSTFSGGSFDCFVTKLASDGQSLIYSTFMGGSSGDYGNAIAVEDGCAYITGHTYSPDFPMVNAYNDTYTTGPTCFVTKFSADGQSLVYSTFLGGGGMHDLGRGIAVESGYAYVTGSTKSSDFPTVDAYDADYNGGTDCFLTKFAIDGQSLIYSTYIGHSDNDYGLDIAVEDTHAYISGSTSSSGFPTQNAYDSSHNGQPDCFVVKFAADGQSLNYSSFLGGSDDDYGYAIAVEDGYAYVTGHTYSGNFPRVNAYDLTLGGTRDCFVTKFSKDGQSLNYSTYLGGSDNDYGEGIAVDAGHAYVTGKTDSSDFPLVEAYDSNYNSDADDCFVTKFALDGKKLIYSTYLGGSYDDCGNDIAVENGYQYIAGETRSPNFPTVDAYEPSLHGSRDCFIAIFSPLDSDLDGLSDEDEERYGTNPHCIDTDNDNFLDGYEIAYGSNATDPADFPAMPQAWYDAIYEDLDGNATLIQNLITWSDGNATLLETVIDQLDANATLLTQVISWLNSNHTAIEILFTYVDGNATLLMDTVSAVNANSAQLALLAAIVTQNTEALSSINATHIGDIDEIRAILDMLGATVGDTDYDGLDDLEELALGTDFQCIDTDCDNLNDAFEVKIGTDPLDDDSDGDTYLDGIEMLAGTDPLDANDYPGATMSPDESYPLVLMIVIAGAGIGVTVVIVLILRKQRGAS
jgi:hypothetical protein